tara:strand:+ start:7034 stop:7951 length:918 start_codon:yes stop_codon:yes gene_type:complete
MSNGVMFHHFHGEKFPKVQGSITVKDFSKIVSYLKKKYKIVSPEEFLNLYQKKNLRGNEVCLTFDDGIKSQKDLILPILERLKIKAFFFIYTSLVKGKPDNLEFYRDFRCSFYKNLSIFYKDFYKNLKIIFPLESKKLKNDYNKNYLINYKFYTKEDRKFRFCRDIILRKKQYEFILEKMMKKKGYKKKLRKKLLFMNAKDLRDIDKKGHTIGLHSHSHPTAIDALSYKSQYNEYSKSKSILEKFLKKKVWSMSHPCGNYNKNSLKILKKKGIKIGFIANLSNKRINSGLEIPREDHADLLSRLK